VADRDVIWPGTSRDNARAAALHELCGFHVIGHAQRHGNDNVIGVNVEWHWFELSHPISVIAVQAETQ
jgi:hypothetical protein